MHCVMDGSSFTIPNETPCADPHAGCCGEGRVKTGPYPISTIFLARTQIKISYSYMDSA